MKSISTFLLLAFTFSAVAQNQITTPAGQPLVIGNQGVKLSNLNSSTPTQATNGKVLTVDANGLLFLAPDNSGIPSQWTNNAANIFFNTGNVGLGTNTPLQRLDVNGDINIPTGNAIRINNEPFLRAPGVGNLFLGALSGSANTSGSNNTFLGANAGKANSTGAHNVFLGFNSGINNTASLGVFIGSNAGASNTTGASNIFIGYSSGQTNTTGTQNVLLGVNSGLNNTTGSYNLFFGANSGYANSTGNYNVFLGYRAGRFNSTGSQNLALGVDAGYNNSTGNYNLFLGGNSGYNNSGGSYNLFFGLDAGRLNTEGNRTIGLGFRAGYNNITGSDNTFIGYNANSTVGNLTNATAIGSQASVSTSNSLVLGGTGTNQVNVGIGNTAPTARLHVSAGGTTVTGVRFENLPNSTGTIYKLYVDANGNLMKSSAAGAREDVESPDNYWKLTLNEHLLNNNAGGIIIGTGITSTPKGYKLYVSEGILTEKVKVAIQNTEEWSDKVFADTYNLRSLTEVETFIKQNKHLPDIPSATEVVEKGVDLGKMDALLLQKIEELTLYIIELKKSNDYLRKEIIELKK